MRPKRKQRQDHLYIIDTAEAESLLAARRAASKRADAVALVIALTCIVVVGSIIGLLASLP